MASSDAGTSSGSEYQVFLSFRGPDTRTGFTDCLFHSLTDAGICVFRDDEELRVGEKIDGSLLRAIDNSRIYIPIFSRNYASSQWCLRELARIVENTFKSEGNKAILPIFFDVEPNDVKLKTPLYCDAILNLERKKKLSNEQVDAWREALVEVDAIKGWEANKYNGHGELIKLVVEEVVQKLKTKHRSVTEHLVGIDDHVSTLSKLLDVNSNGVRLIKIHGMGGIGKTTLAKVVFNQLSSNFGKYCCFLEDVRARSLRTDGLVDLQNRLLSEISHPAGSRSIEEIDYGTKRVGEVLCNKKVLIVLDDVDSNEQIEKLVGKNMFYSGSRILITTRNKDVLQTNTQKYQILDYEMEVMSCECALELFSKHAFNRDSPLDNYNDLSRKIVYSTGRLPLALEVIGSFLYHKSQELWKETLEKLKKAPHEDVFGKLKISYDALNFEQQQIFLDIACFFIGEDKTNAIYMWKDCEFFPNTGVAVLVNMSLIKIVENNKFWMHDQLRDLGRQIVHQENSINLKEQSRIWIWEEGLGAIRSREMKNNVQALSLEKSQHDPLNVVVQNKEIGRFEDLRFLKLSNLTLVGNAANHLTKVRWIFLKDTKLRWISLQIFKWTPMSPNNVVILEFDAVDFLDDSRLQSLIKMASKLKVLSLKRCANITRTSDFSGCPNLERLTFESCSNLRKINGSIGKLKCLIDLKIDYCESLKHLPEEIGDLVNLQYLFVRRGEIKNLPDSIWKLKSLRELHLEGAIYQEKSWKLPSAIGMLKDLQMLSLCNVNIIGSVSSNSRNLSCLNLCGSPKQEIQREGLQLPQLKKLLLRDSVVLERLRLSRMRKLKEVKVEHCPMLVEIQFSRVFESLEALWIASCKSFKRIVYKPANESISCEGRLIFESRVFSKLRSLSLRHCPKTLDIQFVGASESLKQFRLFGCPNVQTLGGLANLKNLKSLNIQECGRLRAVEGVDELEFLGRLTLRGCGSLERLIEVSTTKLPNDCRVWITCGIKQIFGGTVQSLKDYEESRFDWIWKCFGGSW